jgi:L-lysine 2,3-aminomutase
MTQNAAENAAAAERKRRNKRDKSARLSNIRKQIKESKFHRYIAHDIAGYERHVAKGGVKLYSESELEELKKAGVSSRLPPRATRHYLELAAKSEGITNLIKARPEEMEDLSGEKDPSNQLKYSPVPGLLHKYELVLLYVVRTCSSWCRYCYRSDFLTSKTEKDIASVKEITDYIKSYNAKVAEEMGSEDKDRHVIMNDQEKFPIREALLSGGDPMVLSNNNLFDYLDGLADAGLRTIRIGTKELAFFPNRFDQNFLDMLDLFHSIHPDVNIAFMVHFSHPDELLLKNDKKEYVRKGTGHFERIPETEQAIRSLKSRPFVTLENQTPIIDSVNDNAEVLRRLQIELKRIGINNHYYFQCREIEGYRTFAVPLEKAYRIHRDSQKGLSGIEKSRFAMSTEYGKLEVIGMIDSPDLEALGAEVPAEAKGLLKAVLGEGFIILKAHRVPNTTFQGDLVIARKNPEALWISGYEDRIIYDGRKPEGEKYSQLGNLLKTLLAPIVDVASLEDKLDSIN